jgi:hypothetical protein
VAPRFRNEHYVAFLDESGEPGLQVVAGVFIPARWLRSAERRWQEFIRDELGSRSGRTEVKGRELLKGEGVSLHAQTRHLSKGGTPLSAKGAGRQFYRLALEHIAGIAEVRVITVGVKTNQPKDAYRLWFWLAYAALIARPISPRPYLPLVVIDGEDAAFRDAHSLVAYRFYKNFKGRQPYVTGGKQWFLGGSAFHDSATLPFVQMADLVAGVGRHALVKRKSVGGWYDRHLRQFALARGREVDISAHALAELKRRSPTDKCGSGWRGAIIIP